LGEPAVSVAFLKEVAASGFLYLFSASGSGMHGVSFLVFALVLSPLVHIQGWLLVTHGITHAPPPPSN
jgi:hypothetical protein